MDLRSIWSAGLMASRVPLPQWLRFCPQCVQEDRRKFGECYWHRVYQIPGVEICPLHKVWVRNSAVPAQNVQTRYEFISAENAISDTLPKEIDENEQFFEILFAFAHDTQWLLNQRGLSQDLPTFQFWYRRLLADLGLSTYRGRVDRNALLLRFKNMYASELLRMLHCELDEHTEDSWLVRLARKPDNAQHPLHHLLFIHCLEQRAETFFHLPTENKPFGTGPWPCLNPACVHYLEPKIKKCDIIYSSYVSGRPIGTFSCDCGFIYSRTGSDTSAEDRWKRGKIEAFGHVWEKKLGQLWANEKLSLRAIARELGVDPLTIKRQATRMGLSFPRPVRKSSPLNETRQLRPRITRIPEKEKLESYRAVWIVTLQSYPDIGIKTLRSKVPGVYTWLYRNDPFWLNEHRPPPMKRTKQRNSPVDWSGRDQELAEIVRASAERLRKIPGRPSRISLSAIGRDIGQLSLLQQHLGKLPITAITLRKLVESREVFAVRRVQWVTEQYRQDHTHPTRWELVKKAGIERVAMLPAVKVAVEAGLQVLG